MPALAGLLVLDAQVSKSFHACVLVQRYLVNVGASYFLRSYLG
jgi:hypothetical protein